MISSLQGRLESLGADYVIVNVGGIGFQVRVPTGVLSTVGALGREIKLHTHLHLREDNVALYGFSSPPELALFEILLTASGVGPKIALGMLSAMSAEQLAMAIATGNNDLLTTIPGVGKKTASRLILELKDKISAGWAVSPAAQMVQENADVLAALTSLGYSAAEATRAVASLPASDLSLEEKVKLALQYFGSK